MNFPLPAGSGDRELLEAVDRAIERALEFKPDVVGVSAGFDGYHADRLLDLNYTLEGYHQCGEKLDQAFGHIFAVLEGGYHLDALKFANLLQRHAVDKLGVTHLIDHVVKVNGRPDGDIASVQGEKHGEISGDLFVDCSGFMSLLLGIAAMLRRAQLRDAGGQSATGT